MEANKYRNRYVWWMSDNRISTTIETESTLGVISNRLVWVGGVAQWEDEAPTVELLLLKLTRRFLDG